MKIRQHARTKLRERVRVSVRRRHEQPLYESPEALERRLRGYAELTRERFLAQAAAAKAYWDAHPEIHDITVLAGPTRRSSRSRANLETKTITPSGSNVFADLGFEPGEAAALKAESQRIISEKLARKGTPS